MDTPPSPQKSKQKGKKKSSDSDPGGSPLHRGPRKGVVVPPPPMQRRKTQPDFVQELEKELTGRRNTEGKATPPVPRVNGEGVRGETTTTPPTVSEVVGDATSTPSKLVDEFDRPKSTDSPRRGLLRPRTKPAPLPPGAGETGKGKDQIPPPVSAKPPARGHVNQESAGLDEPDFSVPTSGVDKDEEERVESSAAQARNGLAGMEGSITNALKEQAENR